MTDNNQQAAGAEAPPGIQGPQADGLSTSRFDDSEPFDHRPPGRGGPGGLVTALGIVAALLGGGAAGVYWHEPIVGWLGGGHDRGVEPAEAEASIGTHQLWTCGMHPQVIQDHPGTCPICHMKLTPLTADAGPSREQDASGGPAVTIDPVVVQNMGVRVAEVMRGPLRREVRAVGYLAEAEPNVHDVNLRVSGWIQKLYADTVGMHLQAGDPLFDLYSPEVQVAVNELITAKRTANAAGPGADDLTRSTSATLVEAARRKLEQWGLDSEQIDRLAALDQAPQTVTFKSPAMGHLTEKMVVAGAAVRAGDRVLQIVDHSTLWLDAQVYEQDLPFIRLAQTLTAIAPSTPGKVFEGEVVFIHPHVDPVTRTATARIALPNPDLRLRPGMYATAEVRAELKDDAVLAPREAVIDTGTRRIVFVSMGGGRFEPRLVKTGSAGADGAVEVIEGLAAGETVVTSGQFLLDAESRMKEAIQKHLSEKLLAGSGAAGRGKGRPSSSPDMDRLYASYLEIARTLGESQRSDAPVDVAGIVSATQTIAGVANGTAQRVQAAAAAMDDQPLAEQRQRFKALSGAVISLADTRPPSSAIAKKLFVAYCPMEQAHWLQTTDEIANPYYATEMKACGEVQRTIAAAP